jgi:predicted membrane protein
MNDFESRQEEKRRWREERREARKKWMQERWNNKDYQAMHRKGSIWTGVFILLVGAAALVKASVTGLPDWVFSWPSFLIVFGFFIGIRHNFRGIAWFVMMIVGGAFLYQHINPEVAVQRYIWPLALIIVGLFFIVRPGRRSMHGSEKKNGGVMGGMSEETWNDEDFVDSTSIFGGAKKNIISKNFRGGDLVNIFGGTDLDLTQADFTGTAIIELTTIFGGTKLIIPSNWSIQSDAVIIFGGLEDKRRMQTPPAENPDKILILKGTVIFGGIEIKSY